MWRRDAARMASTPHDIEGPLHLKWKREFSKPAPAFPNDPRVCFDISYEPVVSEKRIFVPSMVSDTVTALDVESGEVLWTCFADAPVRFAPIAFQNRVYFISDDGCLYCVSAVDGRAIWKFAAIEPEYGASKLLGNERLISRWPARGGPVLADGIIYFAAGIWPFEGIVVSAVDAISGKPLWVNRDGGWIKDGLLDHGTRRDGGISPQGYLAVIGQKLVVPCGRALPAFFDRATGRIESYTTGWGGRVALAKGCWYVCGTANFLFQSGDIYGMSGQDGPGKPADHLSIAEFARQMKVQPATVDRWIEKYRLETAAIDGERALKIRNDDPITYLSWWTAPPKGKPAPEGEKEALATRPRLNIDPANVKELGIFREPVLTTDAMFYSSPVADPVKRLRDSNDDRNHPTSASYSTIVACDLSNAPRWGATLQGGWGSPSRLVGWNTAEFETLWNLPSELKIHIKAGSRLYGGAHGIVAAVDLPSDDQRARVSWQAAIDGTPTRMLAANDNLFVVTAEGALYCFGKEKRPSRSHGAPSRQPPHAPDEWTARVRRALDTTDIREGYCLVIEPPSPRMPEELLQQSDLKTIVVISNADKAADLRQHFHKRGLYGSRIHVLAGDLNSLRLPQYFASLILTADAQPAPASLFEMLRPYGGTACFDMPAAEHERLGESVAAARIEGGSTSGDNGLFLLRRSGPLRGAADWAHESGDAAHTFSSADNRVKSPFGILWFSGELDRTIPWIEGDPPKLPGQDKPLAFAGAGPRPRISGGRMFVQVADNLFATDVYTGRHLWKRRVNSLGDFAATEDSVHAISGDACLRIDAAKGTIVDSFPSPGGARWREIRVGGDAIVGSAGKSLICLDRHSGKQRWALGAQKDCFGFAIGPDRVFCVDYWLPKHRLGGTPQVQEAEILAVALSDGRLLWKAQGAAPEIGPAAKWSNYSPPLDPQLAFSDRRNVLLFTRNAATAAAYEGSTGRLLWAREIPCKDPPNSFTSYHPPIVIGDRFVTHPGEVLDIMTAEPLMARLWKGANVELRGCGRALGCPNLITVRDAHASYYELPEGAHIYLRGIRAGCTSSLIPANGLLVAPNYGRHCTCNYPLSLSYALVPVPKAPGWDTAPGSSKP